MSMSHPEVFRQFEPWSGLVDAGFIVNFLGVRMRQLFFLGAPTEPVMPRHLAPGYPQPDEEYIEWLTLLTAVVEAADRFTMIELGAGWGRWLLSAAAAARQRGNLPCKLIGVEAEPTHFRWLTDAFHDNGLNPSEHWLIEAAVHPTDGNAPFVTGNAKEWYGQCVTEPPAVFHARQLENSLYHGLKKAAQAIGIDGKRIAVAAGKGLLRTCRALAQGTLSLVPAPVFSTRRTLPLPYICDFDYDRVQLRTVPTISLNSILQKVERVDLIDADIQGAEAAVFEAGAARVDAQVKKVHIETHSPEQEDRLRRLFDSLGWEKSFDYPCLRDSETPWGRIYFQGGVQVWSNPRLRPAASMERP